MLHVVRETPGAFPNISVCGIDIVRDGASGDLFVLEINPLNEWHLSSDNGDKIIPRKIRLQSYRQFDALGRTAELLIEKTRLTAV